MGKTVTIQHPTAKGEPRLIDEADYDPQVHVLFDDPDAGKGEKDDPDAGKGEKKRGKG